MFKPKIQGRVYVYQLLDICVDRDVCPLLFGKQTKCPQFWLNCIREQYSHCMQCHLKIDTKIGQSLHGLQKKSNWFNIRSMFSPKPLYPIGGTMSCSLRRYMVCYYLATLFVLSLDSNTSGLHVNLLAGWTYIGGAGQDSMIGCSISVVSISPLPSLRTSISLV